MTNITELSPRRNGFKYLLLCNLTAVMLAAPCLAESEWPPAEAQDQIQTVNPEDLQPQSFESSPPAETPEEAPAAAETPAEVPQPAEPQPAVEAPADLPAETAAPAEIPAVPPDTAIETPIENPDEAPPATEIPAGAETPPEGTPPQFTENPIITAPEDPPPPPEP